MLNNWYIEDWSINDSFNDTIIDHPLYPEMLKLGFHFDDTPSSGAMYIMPDGKFFSLNHNRDILGLDNSEIACHPQFDVFCLENGLVPEDALINRVLCQSDNAIRVNDGTNLNKEVIVGLPKEMPTESQFNSLISWLYFLMKTRHTIVVGDERTTTVFKEYNLMETFPEDLVKKIVAYYRGGVLREAEEIIKENL